MRNPRRFVVPVDFSREMEATVSAAVALARKWEADVHLLEVVAPRGPSLLDATTDVRAGGEVTSRRAWSRLDDPIEDARRGGIRVRTAVYRGNAIGIVTSYAQLAKATLIVVGQYYGTPRWRRSTRIVSALSRGAPVPVLALPPGWPGESRSLSFAHIVSAVDFTVASAVAVRAVVDLIRGIGASLTLVHALQDAPDHMVFSGGEAFRVARELEARAAQVAQQLQRRIAPDAGIRVDARVTTGPPHRGILDTASEVKADLIVMGVPPRSRLGQVLAGSTLRHVLRRATIPVLVLPVPAGAHRWLEGVDGAQEAVKTSAAPRARRLPAR